MITFLLKNHIKLFLFVSFFSSFGVVISQNLISEINDYYKLKERIDDKSYDGILYQDEQIKKYNYRYDELLEVFNFSTDFNLDFNSILIMQNEDYLDENDVICSSFEAYNCNLKSNEVAISRSLVEDFKLNINDEIRLNTLNEKTFVIKAFINDEAIFYFNNEILNLPLIILAYDESLNWKGNLNFYENQEIYDMVIDNKLELSTLNIVIERFILLNFLLYFSTFVVFSFVNIVMIDAILKLKIIRLNYSELGYKGVYIKLSLLLFIVIFSPWIITQMIYIILLDINMFILSIYLFISLFIFITIEILSFRRFIL